MSFVVQIYAATILLSSASHSAQLQIDLTTRQKVAAADLGMGETRNPSGHRIWADGSCLYQDSEPWLPACGEFQFSRYPRAEWRDELLKMKACGMDMVGSYVFWNHIEEDRGVFNWTDQRSLHDFLKLCQELGLKVLARIGPWAHGECRNGGFPDWLVQESKTKHFRLRSTDAGYLDCVRPFYKQVAAQMKGLLWKDGGPVIGIQVDNECRDLAYLKTLKSMAREYGVDVPLYTMTGWAVPVPDSGLIPMFGRYGDAFWMNEGDPETTKSYLINGIRDDGDMGIIGGKVADLHVDRAEKLARYPHLCIETGGGMQSTYTRRILMKPDDTGALAFCRLASGANMIGYYIFHGAIQPDGKHSSLNESTASGYPFDLPVKDYDFNAPITNCGLLRPSYNLLREQHIFLQSFGKLLAPMPAIFPTVQSSSLTDAETLRWSVRSNGTSGFLFFNNFQQVSVLPAKTGVQFALKTSKGTIQVPRKPLTIPSNAYGIWPINLDCSGVRLQYATAQPLTYISAGGQEWYFFKAIAGIQPEFCVDGKKGQEVITGFVPGNRIAFTRQGSVNFVVLTDQQAADLWTLPINGSNHIVLSKDALLVDSPFQLRIETIGKPASALEIFPPLHKKPGNREGELFESIPLHKQTVKPNVILAKLTHPMTPSPDSKLNAMSDDAWSQAATWKLPVVHGNNLLRINYVGDVARIYSAGKLVADNFYNGAPFDFGLWRIPENRRNTLEIRVMPLYKKDLGRIPSAARRQLNDQPAIAEVKGIESLEKRQLVLRSK